MGVPLIDGIIAPEQGQAIKDRYPPPEQEPAWGRIIFFSIGAILFGLGVILLFAYNWQRMPKLVKLAVIFAALISAHGAGFWLRRPQSPHPTAGEGLHLLGTMIFGAGIWLIAQIYHIDEHYPTALLIWGLGVAVNSPRHRGNPFVCALELLWLLVHLKLLPSWLRHLVG